MMSSYKLEIFLHEGTQEKCVPYALYFVSANKHATVISQDNLYHTSQNISDARVCLFCIPENMLNFWQGAYYHSVSKYCNTQYSYSLAIKSGLMFPKADNL